MAAERLRATIHPFILRRTKAEVAKDLPEKIETDQFCELTGEQAALYAAVLKEVRAQVMGEVERQGLAFAATSRFWRRSLPRLRQAACDLRDSSVYRPRQFGDEDSGKLVALREFDPDVRRGRTPRARLQPVREHASDHQARLRRRRGYVRVPRRFDEGPSSVRVENFQSDDGPPVFPYFAQGGRQRLGILTCR